jgi:hypothetical protein
VLPSASAAGASATTGNACPWVGSTAPVDASVGMVLAHMIPPPPTPPSAGSTTASDAAACWQEDFATLANGGLSVTGESVPANPSELPVG